MMRVLFNSNLTRESFFGNILNSDNFGSWVECYKFFNVPRSVFDKYRNGKLSLPAKLYNRLLVYQRKDKIGYFSRQITFLDDNWGRRKGGKITYIKYKRIFSEGREKGITLLNKKTHHFDINQPLTRKLAYFIGLFIGDGFCNKYGSRYFVQFTGHKTEKDFYKNLISTYTNQLFGLIPRIKEGTAGNFIRVNLHSKDLFLLLTERFKIKAGRKSSSVLIPREILNSSDKILFSCISGIYDAECCIFSDKRKNYERPYPRIDLHMVNPQIIKQVSEIFEKHNLPHSVSGNFVRIYTYGFDNISKFLEKIELLNPKHLSKLRFAGINVGLVV